MNKYKFCGNCDYHTELTSDIDLTNPDELKRNVRCQQRSVGPDGFPFVAANSWCGEWDRAGEIVIPFANVSNILKRERAMKIKMECGIKPFETGDKYVNIYESDGTSSRISGDTWEGVFSSVAKRIKELEPKRLAVTLAGCTRSVDLPAGLVEVTAIIDNIGIGHPIQRITARLVGSEEVKTDAD